MAVRSVSELLPVAFDELTAAHVEAIVEALREERESLFFERKEEVNPRSLAKACAAFANTEGGLLIVGIADDGRVIGIDAVGPEPQLWVKDSLRGHILPMPSFRSRWLELEDGNGQGLLLVQPAAAHSVPPGSVAGRPASPGPRGVPGRR